jgi:hypothetical protein
MQLILLDPCPHYCTFARLGLCVYRAGHGGELNLSGATLKGVWHEIFDFRFFPESVSFRLLSNPAEKLFSGVNATPPINFSPVSTIRQ